MAFDFDDIIPRRHTNCYKWDTAKYDDVLPMWVADMDFRTAPAIIEAIIRKANHGIFGYAMTPDAYYEAMIAWSERRHAFSIQKEWVLCTTGVVPAVSAIIKALTVPGDQVIIQTPVYNCFFSSIRNNECEVSINELINRDGYYYIDFDDLEKKASNPKAKVFLLCSPHNPVGRIWTKEELNRMGEICQRHHVVVLSDEIHNDLVYEKHRHIPFATVSEAFRQNSVTCTAPSKTFNLAGLKVANIIVSDEEMRRKIDKALNVNEVNELNAFAAEALIAAYNEGGEWLDELIPYLYNNYLYLKDFIATELPLIKVTPLEATYLVWLDMSALKKSSETMADELLNKYKLLVNKGTMYGANGEGFIRLNIACPRELLAKGLEKIKHFITSN